MTIIKEESKQSPNSNKISPKNSANKGIKDATDFDSTTVFGRLFQTVMCAHQKNVASHLCCKKASLIYIDVHKFSLL